MPIFYLSTERKTENSFELFQNRTIGFESIERSWTIETTDKIEAVIINLGEVCCNYIPNHNHKRAVVSLVDDRDTATGKEHFEIYSVIYSPVYFEKMHNHFRGIYGNKIAWLDKIHKYILAWQIDIWLHNLEYKRVFVNFKESKAGLKEVNFNSNKQDKTVKRIIKNR